MNEEKKKKKQSVLCFLRFTRHAFRFICLLHIDCVFIEFSDEAKHRQFHNRTHSIAPYDRININKERNTEVRQHNKYIVEFIHANSRWKETDNKSIHIRYAMHLELFFFFFFFQRSYVVLVPNLNNARPFKNHLFPITKLKLEIFEEIQ